MGISRAQEKVRPAILQGKVAVVTGAGSGIGRAIAQLLADKGCTVMVVDVIPERVDQVVGEIRAAGKNASGLVIDLSIGTEVDRMIESTLSSFGKIDILCNNAGIMDGARPVADTPDEVWERVLAINLNAPFRASRKVIPIMIEHGGGAILNTASIAGIFGARAGVAYTVSKHGLIGLTKSIATSYGAKGIRCNALVLGAVQTAIGIGSTTPNPLGMENLNKTMATLPRVADPAEVARLAVFLVSDDSSYMNGSSVVADAGWTAF
ncbi:MAG: SDR family oxidoreductase [Nitrososphaerales archaeon]|nr:SDR family oxidoreductase [Nitrososphaerales archaeon]